MENFETRQQEQKCEMLFFMHLTRINYPRDMLKSYCQKSRQVTREFPNISIKYLRIEGI